MRACAVQSSLDHPTDHRGRSQPVTYSLVLILSRFASSGVCIRFPRKLLRKWQKDALYRFTSTDVLNAQLDTFFRKKKHWIKIFQMKLLGSVMFVALSKKLQSLDYFLRDTSLFVPSSNALPYMLSLHLCDPSRNDPTLIE